MFGRRVAAGRAAVNAGDLSKAVAEFGRALGLWRGAAADALSRANGLGERLAALDEQRLAVVEELIDTRQRLGEDAQIISELRQLTIDHPLRERFWCQLIGSLYRSGDIGGALSTWDHARTTLVEQLGLDPGPELTRLQQAMLARDPSLTAATAPPEIILTSAPTSARAVQIPRELPPDVGVFVGRSAELARVRAIVHDPHTLSLIAVHGPAGIGKSAFAVHMAHSLCESFPDGQIYVNLHGATHDLPAQRPTDVLARFLRALGVPDNQMPETEEEAAARFRSLVAPRRIIFILDNATDEAQVRPLLTDAKKCVVIITSRKMLAALDNAAHIELRTLSQDTAVVLLGRLCGDHRVAAEPEQAARLVALCDRLPLALRVAGARLASRPKWSISCLVEQLIDERKRLDVLSFGDLAVRSSLEVGLRHLAHAESRRLFRLLGLLRLVDMSVPVAGTLMNVSNKDAGSLLGWLADARLVEQTAPDRYRLHNLTRVYAAELAEAQETPEARAAAVGRVLAYYLNTARRASYLLRPGLPPGGEDTFREPVPRVTFAGPLEANTWLEAELANLVVLARQLATQQGPATRFVSPLTVALYQYLSTHRRWDELAELATLSKEIAGHNGDRRAEATALVCLATVSRQRGRPQKALSSSHHTLEIRNQTAEILCRLGRFREALTQYRRAFAIRRAEGDLLGEAITRVGLGKIAVLLGRHGKASELLTNALARCRETSDHRHE